MYDEHEPIIYLEGLGLGMPGDLHDTELLRSDAVLG